jgi:hypothetical protein
MLRLMVVAGGALAIASCGGPPACPAVYADTQIQLAATSITPPTIPPFPPISAATTAAPAGTMVSIVSNQGTVAFGGRGPFPAFIYSRIPFASADATLYGGLGVEDGVWFPFWLYCTSDGRLTNIYGEMSDRDDDAFPDVDGTCSDQGVAYPTTISLPAQTLSRVALTCGFTASAPLPDPLELVSSSVGSMSLLGDASSVYPFHTVDCRSGCGSPGWYEIHSIVWNPIQQVAAFGIFYLDETGVTLDDGVMLPSGEPVIGDAFSGATWSLSR